MQVTPPESQANVSSAQTSSLSDLGKSIRARTTDFIAICIIIFLGLTVGQQLIFWWQVDKSDIMQNPAQQALPLTNWDQLVSPVTIQFGPHHEIVRAEFLGSKEIVFPKIIDSCLKYAQHCQSVSTGAETTSTTWKTTLSQFTPVTTDDQGHAIYSIDGPYPLLIGISGYQDKSQLQDARIVCVASYTQVEPDHWKLNISSSKHALHVSSHQKYPGIPPGCKLGLALQNQTGDSMTQFSGDITLTECWEHFDHWAYKHNYVRENSSLNSEQLLLQRVYNSASPITQIQDQNVKSSDHQLKPISDHDLNPIEQTALKVIIQIRQDRNQLHGMIHTFPESNRLQ